MSKHYDDIITTEAIQAKGESMGKGIFVILISQLMYLFVNYALFYYLGKRFIEGDFGNYQAGYRLILAFELAMMYGIPVTVAKYVSEDARYLGFFMGKGMWLQMKFAIGLYVVYIIVAAVLILCVWQQGIVLFLIFLFAGSDIILYSIYNIRMSVLNPIRKYTREAVIVICYSLSRFIATIIFVEMGLPRRARACQIDHCIHNTKYYLHGRIQSSHRHGPVVGARILQGSPANRRLYGR